MDCASDAQGDATPEPGDITLCLYCAAAMVFQDDMSLKPCDVGVLPEDERAYITKMQALVLLNISRRPN